MHTVTPAPTIPDLQATWTPDDTDVEPLHTAVSALYFQDRPVVTEWFRGSTEAEARAAVEAWADQAFKRVYEAVVREFS
jgi:hypothetical protein